MILIADGGSTKCDWIVLDENGELVFETRTEGLNPAVFDASVLKERLEGNEDLKNNKSLIKEVHFYGAGCGTPEPIRILENIFKKFFPDAKIEVQEDMVAAVFAATTEPGIVCILGTGSNSCYYDGEEIHMEVESLGYVLMDEASGNYFGKRLIRDYYYKRMPKTIAQEFEKRYDLDADAIKHSVYRSDNPNTYLASFAEFIFTSEERNGYFYLLITEGIKKFVENRVMCFPEAQNVPIHFIGSIAHFSRDIIRDALLPYHLTMGNIVRRPIEGIIDYYRNKLASEKKKQLSL